MGDRFCKGKFKTLYKVRRRQWERRAAVHQWQQQQL